MDARSRKVRFLYHGQFRFQRLFIKSHYTFCSLLLYCHIFFQPLKLLSMLLPTPLHMLQYKVFHCRIWLILPKLPFRPQLFILYPLYLILSLTLEFLNQLRQRFLIFILRSFHCKHYVLRIIYSLQFLCDLHCFPIQRVHACFHLFLYLLHFYVGFLTK